MFFFLGEISFGFGFQHFQLVNEKPRRIDILDHFATFGVCDLAHKHHRHIGLLQNQLSEEE